jgi:transposase-like protein
MHAESSRKSPLQALTDGTLTEAAARTLYEGMRWPNGIVCPLDECGGSGAWRIQVAGKTLKSGRVVGPRCLYKCKACKRQFSVTKGTIFEDSKIPLRMWLVTMYRMCSSKKGIAARQISRELGISPENAWFMLHRIRFAMTDKNPTPLTGVVEADETYVGGKPRGHAKMRAAKYTMSERITIAKANKTPVFGMKERGGRIRAQAIPGITQKQVERALFENIDHTRARLMTDEAPYYYWMKQRLPHDVIRHSSTYVRGEVHTQGIESFWATLKRGLTGIHHHVDAGYLNQYVQEFAFRANTRHMSDTERSTSLVKNVGGRLYWYHGKRTAKVSQPYEQDEPYERV